MAVGALPSEANGRPHKIALNSITEPVSPPLLTPPSPVNALDTRRPFFWEIIPLCDLYWIAHVILLPSSLRSSYNPSPLRDGRTKTYTKTNGVNGHQPPKEAPTRFADALASLGLGPANWGSAGVSVFTAILPTTDGYVSRSDFLQLRLQDFPFPVAKIQECVAPFRKYTAYKASPTSGDSEDSLAELLQQAAGVIQWADKEASVSFLDLHRYLLYLTHELRDRLDHAPWLTPHPISRKRVALVRGRPNLTAGGPVYRAARALGLDLVIIDDDGHWLQPDTEDNRLHREAFLATDMTEDSGVVDRIIASIARYPLPIHGVFTLSDNFFVTTAKVASALGLPTNPVSAFETSVDKYRSRLLQDAPGHAARVTSVAELDALLSPRSSSSSQPPFTPIYPLIVKPTKGWSSECVSKVSHPSDLAEAVAKATARHGSAAVIEPFFDGPEIDANFVMLDGEVLFSEVADEPPCAADDAAAGVQATFSPEALTMPSALPAEEQMLARETLAGILVGMGFVTGVFHVEARIVGSGVEYCRVDGSGDGDGSGGDGENASASASTVVDLAPKRTAAGERTTPLSEKTACKLVEINARPPGYRVSVPSRHVYGVDYFAVHMLAAVGDAERLRLAARPFDHHHNHHHQDHYSGEGEGRTRGAQYWSRLVYVPAPKEGVVRWPEGLPPCEVIKRRRPDLRERIVVAVDYCVPGDKVGLFTDGARTYVAHLLVCSRVSRRDAIEVGNEVLKAFEIEMEEVVNEVA